MIAVSDLSLRFGKRTLFEHVTIKFKPGYCYGIVGANGAGKSTFLKLLSGQLKQDEGDIVLDPGVKMGILSQDQYGFEEDTVLDVVLMGREELYKISREKDALYAKPSMTQAEGERAAFLEAEFMEKDGYTVAAQAGEMLEGLGIETSKHEWKMKQLAGGWKLRVLLAQILYKAPDLLMLDEPTNHLDIQAINWLEDYLNAYEGTIIMVSHDRHFLNRICTHIVDVDRQKITSYAGNYDFFVAMSKQALDAKTGENARKEKRIAELKEFIARFSANASKSAQATSRAKLLDKIELEEIVPSSRQYPRLQFKVKSELGKDVVSVEGLSKGFGDLQVLKGIDLSLQNGERLAVLGPNGAGKTTFLKCLLSAWDDGSRGLAPDAGSIKWGSSVRLSSMPQDAKEELGQDCSMVQWLKQFAPQEENQVIRGILGRMLFSGEQQEKNIKVLSGGECQRLILSRMMLEGGNVLMLDEPTNHMDLESIESMADSFSSFPGAVIFTSHDQDLISRVATRILALRMDGSWVDFKGSYEEYQAAMDKEARERRKRG